MSHSVLLHGLLGLYLLHGLLHLIVTVLMMVHRVRRFRRVRLR